MSIVWKWFGSWLGANGAPDHSQLVDQLDHQLWPSVCKRTEDLTPSQLGGYVWAVARATGLLPVHLPAVHNSSILDQVVVRFSKRIADQRSQSTRQAA